MNPFIPPTYIVRGIQVPYVLYQPVQRPPLAEPILHQLAGFGQGGSRGPVVTMAPRFQPPPPLLQSQAPPPPPPPKPPAPVEDSSGRHPAVKEEATLAPTNLFKNDGSFFEQFNRMKKGNSSARSKKTALVSPYKKSGIFDEPDDDEEDAKEPQTWLKKGAKCAKSEPGSSSSGISLTRSQEKSGSEPGVANPIGAEGSGASEVNEKSTGRKRRSRWSDEPPKPPKVPLFPTANQKQPPAPLLGGPYSRIPPPSFMAVAPLAVPPCEQEQIQKCQEQVRRVHEELRKQGIKMGHNVTVTPNSLRPPPKGSVKFEYDSDEDTEGGTWEHRQRAEEMNQTEVTKTVGRVPGEKKHMSNYLPPEEWEAFNQKLRETLSKSGKKKGTSESSGENDGERPEFSGAQQSSDVSDYQDNRLDQSNLGFKMLQKMGWSEGRGLGSSGHGITAPISKGKAASDNLGLGFDSVGEPREDDDIYNLYRKRMMSAYKHRPNPLNNPRRQYY